MSTIRLTAAQATVRFLAAQMTELDGRKVPLFAGVFAIFGHGNVAALGEALYGVREQLPTYRAHNEQAMAHSAIAYAKAMRRRRMMAVTTSIGPGATNMVTAAAVAHVNRIPRAAAARRRLRQPPARPGAAADRGFRRRHDQRQ
jgi:3D-(3,5/4)-trihydroxycyclohexane-1,2-dione acylhydrolase (decyclizing)